MCNKSAFTLIEFMIAIAILAILAAIAIPNLAEAQLRSKVSRAKNDLRTISIGLESYHLDHKVWPCYMGPNAPDLGKYILWTEYLNSLSTPIAYLDTTFYSDPFSALPGSTPWTWYPKSNIRSYSWREFTNNHGNRNWFYGMARNYNVTYLDAFVIASNGPSREYMYPELFILNWYTNPWSFAPLANPICVYDPTNGAVSQGNIERAGGAAPIITASTR